MTVSVAYLLLAPSFSRPREERAGLHSGAMPSSPTSSPSIRDNLADGIERAQPRSNTPLATSSAAWLRSQLRTTYEAIGDRPRPANLESNENSLLHRADQEAPSTREPDILAAPLPPRPRRRRN